MEDTRAIVRRFFDHICNARELDQADELFVPGTRTTPCPARGLDRVLRE